MLQTCTQCGSCRSGQKDHPGWGGSHWEPLTTGLDSLWGGLGPLHWHNFLSGLGASDQARVRPSAGPPAPQGCTPGAAENKPGVPKPSWRDRFGGCYPQGALGMVTTRPMGRWWGTSNPHSTSPLLHLYPTGHPAIGAGLWGLSGAPGPGLCPPPPCPHPGHRSRDARGPAERHGGMRAVRRGRQPRSSRAGGSVPLKTRLLPGPSATKPAPGSAPVPFPSPALSPPACCCRCYRRRSATSTGRGPTAPRSPWLPRAASAPRGPNPT